MLPPSERVLDVAAGNGNATLAAARRFAQVTSTDYVGALLERAGQNNRAISTAKPKKPAQLGDRATGVAANSSPVPAERRGDTGEVLSALARRGRVGPRTPSDRLLSI